MLRIFLILMVFNCGKSFSQIRLSTSISGGLSKFVVTGLTGSPDYQSGDLKVGLTAWKPLYNIISFRSGLSVGAKLKRPPYSGTPRVLANLNDATSEKNHVYIQVPVMIQFNFFQDILSINGGVVLRQWMPNRPPIDLFSAKNEIGYCLSISKLIQNNFVIGAEFFKGISPITSGTIGSFTSPTLRSFNIKNQSIHLELGYILR